MKKGLVIIIFLLQLSEAFPQADSIRLFTVTIADSCSLCSGAEHMLYADTTLANAKEINYIIAGARVYTQPPDDAEPDDFVPKDEVWGPDDCIGHYSTPHVKLNGHHLLSFEYEAESNCGTSVSSPHELHYLTIDVSNSRKLDIVDIIDPDKMDDFQHTVMTYAKKNKIDNIPYCCFELKELTKNEFHDQSKIEYLAETTDQFYLTRSSLGIYIKVYDNNPVDWYHRGSDEVVGNEQVLAEIPYGLIRKYLERDSPIAKLVSKK